MSLAGQVRHQFLCAGQSLHRGQVALPEDLPSALGQALPFRRVLFHADELREHLVATHADEGPHACEGHLVARFGERIHPGERVGVVAVHERAVDIEDDRSQRRQMFVDIDHVNVSVISSRRRATLPVAPRLRRGVGDKKTSDKKTTM